MKKLILIFVLLAGHAWATVLTVGYVSQTAAGTGDGLSSGNAASLANHNANTIPGGTITSGTACTIHLVGTLSTQLVAPVGGTSGNLITYIFDTNAKLSAPFWGLTTSAAFVVNAKHFVTVDGGVNGLIECTANGTALANQIDSCGLYAVGSHDFVVQNLTINNIYQRTAFSADTHNNQQGIDVGDANNVSCVNCTMAGAGSLIGFEYGSDVSNWLVDGNTLSNCNHAITVGTTSSNLTGLTVRNNRINHLDYWQGFSGNHLDGIIIQNNTNSAVPTFTNAYFYNNYIGPDIGSVNTGAIFFAVYDDAQVVNLRIYDNLFTQTSPSTWSNGFLVLTASTNSFVLNNTFVAYDTGGLGTSTGIGINIGGSLSKSINLTCQNNVFSSVGTPYSVGSSSVWPTNLTSNHNVFYDVGAGSGSFYGPSFAAGNLAYWQGQGYDLDAVTTTPNLDSNYFPVATSSAIGTGADESVYFTVDKAGVTWSTGTGWGKGALKVAGSTGAGGSVIGGKVTLAGKATIK